MNKEIEDRLEKLESYVSDEMDLIRKLYKNLTIKVKDVFTVTTYKEVCLELKEQEETCPYKKIKQLEKFFNGNWKKDWSNSNQRKYYPYFKYEVSSGWSLCAVGDYDGSDGAPAFYKDEKTVRHIIAQKEFMDIYKEYLNN